MGSQLAADYLRDLTSQTNSDSDAIVLVSGGATSLIAAPVDGLSEKDLRDAFATLLASGIDIELMNAVRKRLLRFGAGRLALALQCRRVHCRIASDVIGNDPAFIASGPCVPETSNTSDVRARMKAGDAWEKLPAGVRLLIDSMADGRHAGVPPRNHPRFASTTTRVILDRTEAEQGAAAEAQALGVASETRRTPLRGDAATMGMQFAQELASRSRHGQCCVIWSGETTVSLADSPEPGGRCQEFALACAGVLERAGPEASGITVLAAGTDGRDGPTDAAGAIVDALTWSAIRYRGVDPADALRHHASYHALEAADALLKTGSTGTNVNDLVIALLT
jgi:hydroxypyruvate reductase